MGTRAGLDNMEERTFLTLLGLELQALGHPAHTQSLYELCILALQMRYVKMVVLLLWASKKTQIHDRLDVLGRLEYCVRSSHCK
jgi:hypothetical protein